MPCSSHRLSSGFEHDRREHDSVTPASLEIVAVVDEGLGHSSHIVGLRDGAGLVVDPARFPDRHRQIAADRGWTIAWTADTHSHADYISGSPELAGDGATFLASRGAGLEVPHRSIGAGDTVALAAGIELRAIATPGHTPDHLAFLLLVDGQAEALFSGGSLLVGAVGRTDLLGHERRDELARALFHALREEILTLPDDLPVYPTHGAGSFCSAPAGAAATTTIGTERASNPLLSIDDEDRFVATLLDGLGSFPTYFRQLPEINRRGPRIHPDIPTLERLDVATVRRHLDDGAVLVDARPIESFASGHITGSLSIAHRPAFASWLGWLVPLGAPVLFLLDEDTDRRELVRQCLTIGHERLLGELDGGIDAWLAAGLPTETIPLVPPTAVSGTLIDVRQDPEWNGGHVSGALHIELADLRGAEVPAGPLTVMCGHGERAMTGASILAAAGHGELTVLAGGPADLANAIGRDLHTA
jgi:glyoxylase-like metal-dependent hydrolase (beta-lactamase superfamily II)/rhodanese-related sulfurtransferase